MGRRPLLLLRRHSQTRQMFRTRPGLRQTTLRDTGVPNGLLGPFKELIKECIGFRATLRDPGFSEGLQELVVQGKSLTRNKIRRLICAYHSVAAHSTLEL